jgi:hypothetical protein
MTTRINPWILVAALAVAGCGQQKAPANHDAPDGSRPAASAAPSYSLGAKGLEPGLAFGMLQAPAVAAAVKAFGEPTRREHNNECGQGPMDLVNFHDLSLEFDSGRLVGWSLSGATPSLRTAGGLAIGAPASVLGAAPIDHDSSLGLEFEVGGVGGLIDDQETRITALWAGSVCQFG